MGKVCGKCKLLLEDSAFSWKVRNVKRSSYCKDCSRALVQRQQMYAYLGEYLSSHPCVDCGERDVLVLEFDHKNREDKIIEVSGMIRQTASMKKLIAEIEKCDVRCANCHRRKTEKENNSWKLTYAPVA